MKTTEEIREQLAIEENDLKALGLSNQLIREERNERFEETWLPKLQSKCNVKHDAQACRYTFELNGYGVMDFYPKANKLLIRKLNKWKKPALKWLIAKFHLEADGSATEQTETLKDLSENKFNPDDYECLAGVCPDLSDDNHCETCTLKRLKMKTVEEKAGEYAEKTEAEYGFDMHPKTASFQGFIDGYSEAMRWREPKVEQPKNGKPVIVKYMTARGIKKYGIAKYFELGIGNPWTIEGSTGREVIGWRPIE